MLRSYWGCKYRSDGDDEDRRCKAVPLIPTLNWRNHEPPSVAPLGNSISPLKRSHQKRYCIRAKRKHQYEAATGAKASGPSVRKLNCSITVSFRTGAAVVV